MIVVHGLLSVDGRIGLWAETTAPAPPGDDASRHPFATRPPASGEAGVRTLILPGDGAGPLPSPELDPAHGRTATGSAAWSVPVVLVEPGVDPEALIEEAALTGEACFTAGASVGSLGDVVSFTRDLVRRGRVVPVVTEEGGQPAARWWPLLIGRDGARFDDLRRSLPGVAHCVPEGVDLLDHLRAAVDALVRARLTDPLAPAATGWLAALTGPSATFVAPTGEARRLRDRIDRWVASATPGPIRTCFRLSVVDEGETDDEPAGWLLEFLLQPVADPSVLVPAHAGVARRRRPAGRLGRRSAGDAAGRAGPGQPALPRPRRRAARSPAGRAVPRHGRRAPFPHPRAVAGRGRLRRPGAGPVAAPDAGRPHPDRPHATDNDRRAARPDGEPATRSSTTGGGSRWATESLTENELVELARAKLPLVRLRGPVGVPGLRAADQGPGLPRPGRHRADDRG